MNLLAVHPQVLLASISLTRKNYTHLDVQLVAIIEKVANCVFALGVVQEQQFDVSCRQVCRNEPLVEFVDCLQIPKCTNQKRSRSVVSSCMSTPMDLLVLANTPDVSNTQAIGVPVLPLYKMNALESPYI